MAEEKPFETHYICRCGWYYKQGDLGFHETCPWCGNPYQTHDYPGPHWRRVRRRWISKSVWYKPWTWLSGDWEYQNFGKRV